MSAYWGEPVIPQASFGSNRSDKVIAGIINNVLQCAIGDICQYQFRTLATKLARQLPTEAAAGTGNQDCLVSQVFHRHMWDANAYDRRIL